MPQAMRDFALEVHFSKWEFKARYNLTGSDAESRTIADLLSLASDEDRHAFENLHLGYTETFGSPALRQAIAETYESLSADDILCFAGAGEGIFVAMQVLLKPGDHAIVLTPNYQSAETVPLSICDVSGVALDASRSWALDLNRLCNAIRPNTRLVSINFPNNPTGAIPSQDTMNELVELCRKRGLWLFSDEVYRGIETDASRRVRQIADGYEKGLSLNVMSKAYGLPGLRIGWIACRDRELLVRMERRKHYLSICNSAPSEVLARIALKARDRIIERNLALIRQNVVVAQRFFARYPALFDFAPPDGGCVCFVRYKGADGVEEFTRRLVEEAGVLLLPSTVYRSEIGKVPENYFRLGLGRTLVPAAFDAMDAWIQKWQL
ncbi:MAG TPA: pyridoxal phosphate-dependent aminotransferase [Woeseiaceae bacterium]|nr:pyridoxal phosphate-dependent aminotransferase [Woeseiaceae bacterium]